MRGFEAALPEPKKAFDRHILIERLPMNAESAAKQLPVVSLFWCRVKESRIPFERHRDLTSVGKSDLQLVTVAGHVNGQGLNFDRCKTHNAFS